MHTDASCATSEALLTLADLPLHLCFTISPCEIRSRTMIDNEAKSFPHVSFIIIKDNEQLFSVAFLFYNMVYSGSGASVVKALGYCFYCKSY